MNSLKFINTEIEFCYLTINKAKEENLYQKTLSILIPENKNINLAVINDLQISLNEEKIKHFQQIKDILEAWEVCINDNAILDVLKTLAKGESINWHRLPEEKQKILKKVLEVKENG